MSAARRPAQPTSRRSIKRWDGRGWSWLLPELRRSMIALALGLLGALGAGLAARLSDRAAGLEDEVPVIFILGYLASYLVLTLAAFLRTGRQEVERWAVSSPDSSVWRQLLSGSQPGPSMASGVGLIGLVIGVFWLPAVSSMAGGSQVLLTIVLAVLLLVTAWSVVPVTYAAAYLRSDVRSGYRALDLPGEEPRSFLDYLYLALAVSTTFGTTDVSVRQTRMRMLLSTQTVLAFIFNTVVLAAVVSVLVNLR